MTTVLGVVGEGLVELGLERGGSTTAHIGVGGDAPNAAVMAARMGSRARIGGRVGGDALGRRLIDHWELLGIDVAHVLVDEGAPTGIYVNELGADGLHRFDYHRRGSAGSRLEPTDLGESFFADLEALHTTGITLAVSPSSRTTAREALHRASAAAALVSLAVNHRPALGGSAGDVAAAAAAADVVFASDDEVHAVFGTSTAALPSMLPAVRELVVTHGAAGASVHTGGMTATVAAPHVEAVDAAGAGDALAGAYLATRLAGGDPDQALAAGVAAASLSCRARGCALSYPSAREVREEMERRAARSLAQ